MRNCAIIAVSILVAGAAGCATGGRKGASVGSSAASAATRPTPELVAAAAPALAGKLNDWHRAHHADEYLLIRGPTFIGLEGVLAPEAAVLGATLVDAINSYLAVGLRFVPAATMDLAPFGPVDLVLDSRVLWELPERRAAHQEPSLLLDIVNPRDGDVLASVRHRLQPPPPEPERATVAVAPPDAAFEVEPEAVPDAIDVPTPRPAFVDEEPEPEPAPPLPDSGARSAFAFGARPDPAPSASDAAAKAGAQPSAVVRLEHGVIYFENAELARRVAVVQGQVTRLPDGRLRVRHVMTARKKSTSIELRFEFYDAAGGHAGTVDGVDFRVWAGRGSSTAVVSRLPAERYILFIKD